MERNEALAILHSDRFADRSPGQVVAVLLDEGRYVCTESTLYRLLREHGELRERRRQRRHPEYRKPELLATPQAAATIARSETAVSSYGHTTAQVSLRRVAVFRHTSQI